MTAEVAVIIVTYNAEDIIAPCLESLTEEKQNTSLHIIVVDNQSKDKTVQIVRDGYPHVDLIETGYNAGYSGGNNIGLKHATSPFLFVLNPDTVVTDGTIGHLVDFMKANEDAGMVGCHLEYPDGKMQHSTFKFPNLKSAFYGFFTIVEMNSEENGRYPISAYDEVRQVQHILGAALLIRREIIETVGLMDHETFPMYFEETDLCYRVYYHSPYNNYYIPDGKVIHYESYTTSKYKDEMSIAFQRSQARFFRKHYGLGHYLILKLISFAGISVWFARSLRQRLLGRMDHDTWIKRVNSYGKMLLA